MKTWKNKMQSTVSLERFKMLWVRFMLKNRNLSAFELYCAYIAQKEPEFQNQPDIVKLDRYKADLKSWGWTL